ELIDEHPPVEAEHVGVGAQERLREGVTGKKPPLLVLKRAQVLRADLRASLELGDVEVLAHPRLPQHRADVGHFEAEAYSATGAPRACGIRRRALAPRGLQSPGADRPRTRAPGA